LPQLQHDVAIFGCGYANVTNRMGTRLSGPDERSHRSVRD